MFNLLTRKPTEAGASIPLLFLMIPPGWRTKWWMIIITNVPTFKLYPASLFFLSVFIYHSASLVSGYALQSQSMDFWETKNTKTKFFLCHQEKLFYEFVVLLSCTLFFGERKSLGFCFYIKKLIGTKTPWYLVNLCRFMKTKH